MLFLSLQKPVGRQRITRCINLCFGSPPRWFVRIALGRCEVWIATVKAVNGIRRDLPVAFVTGDGYRPYTGVAWVLFPPHPVDWYRFPAMMNATAS